MRRRAVAANQEWPSDNMPAGDSFVSRCVRLMDTAPEASRAGSEFIHVSSLVGGQWCPRAFLLTQRMGIHNQSVQGQMRVVWVLGRAAEHHVRSQFILAHGRHRVIGRWSCVCGETVIDGRGNHTKLCPRCGKDLNVYLELTLNDPASGIVGNADLIFDGADGWIEVVEIKSIKKDDFEKLTGPTPTHSLQCMSYVRLLKASMPGVKVRGRVLYVAKDYVSPKTSPYKEYALPNSGPTETTGPVLDALFESAKDTQAHKKARTYPARLSVCASPHSTRAKNCIACNLCFSL